MSNHAPLHTVEIVFYTAASFLLLAAMTWFFLK
jgi:hypothetical protein